MKHLLLILFVSFLLFIYFTAHSQPYYSQVCNFQPVDTNKIRKTENGTYVYETDTLLIGYTWAGNVFSFAIFNKLDKPIYLDKKRSAFIDDSNDKFPYWNPDKYVTSQSDYKDASIPLFNTGIRVRTGKEATTTTFTQHNRIEMIFPKSYYGVSVRNSRVITDYYFILALHVKSIEVNLPSNPKKKTYIHELNISKDNSPGPFRNILAFSFTEDCEEVFYIDNGFYLSNIKEITYDHRYWIDKDKKFHQPFACETCVTLSVPKRQSVDYRRKKNK